MMKGNKAKKPKILLVEDDPNLSLVLQDYLEMLDYNIVLCNNGKDGLEKFLAEKCSILISESLKVEILCFMRRLPRCGPCMTFGIQARFKHENEIVGL